MNESEKVSTNLGVVELAQIDVLVEQGHFSNRSDFIRTAIRKELEVHSPKIERHFSLFSKKNFTLGIFIVTKDMLTRLAKNNEKLDITVVGMIVFNKDISKGLFDKTIGSITIKGKTVATDEIKEAIRKMNSTAEDQTQEDVNSK